MVTVSPTLKNPPHRTYKNPTQSVISRELPYRLAVHHIFRATQVLIANQNAGRFPTQGDEYETYVGAGRASTSTDSAGSVDPTPPSTRKRSLASMSQESYLRGGYHPFPGRIYFNTGREVQFLEAVIFVLAQFQRIAARGNEGPPKKNHPFRYAESLAVYLNGTRYEPTAAAARLATVEAGSIVEIINYAPHAAALELDRYDGSLSDRFDTLYFVFRDAQARFAPAVQMGYDYISSDYIGLVYGSGTGGPSQATASRTGRAKTYSQFGGGVYALPRISIAVDAVGAANLKAVRPGGRRTNLRNRRG